jgi:hypothetical protein
MVVQKDSGYRSLIQCSIIDQGMNQHKWLVRPAKCPAATTLLHNKHSGKSISINYEFVLRTQRWIFVCASYTYTNRTNEYKLQHKKVIIAACAGIYEILSGNINCVRCVWYLMKRGDLEGLAKILNSSTAN